MQARNTGTNQRGELVFSLLATAFVPRRNRRIDAMRYGERSMVTGGYAISIADYLSGTIHSLTHCEPDAGHSATQG